MAIGFLAPAVQGLTLITAQTFSATTSVNVNSCFSSTYQNYKLILVITSVSATTPVHMRMRSGTTTNTSSNYYWNRMYIQGTTSTVQSSGTSTEDSMKYVGEFSTGIGTSHIEVFTPFETNTTSIITQSNFNYVPSFPLHTVVSSGQTSVTTSYDGFTLITTGATMTGNLRVYGYNN